MIGNTLGLEIDVKEVIIMNSFNGLFLQGVLEGWMRRVNFKEGMRRKTRLRIMFLVESR